MTTNGPEGVGGGVHAPPTSDDDALVRELHGYIQQLKQQIAEKDRLLLDMDRQIIELRSAVQALMAETPPRPASIWDCFDHTPKK